jgi:hypothetical protein
MSEQDEPITGTIENGNAEDTRGLSGVSTPFASSLPPTSVANGDSGGVSSLPLVPSGDGLAAGKDPSTGRFLPGNRLGRGSPLAGQAAKLRAALFRAVKGGDLQTVITALMDKAKGGDTAAAKLILQYTLGDPVALDIVETIQRLEAVYIKERG